MSLGIVIKSPEGLVLAAESRVTLTTTLAEVQKEAQQECAAGTLAEPADTDWYLQNCPLLLPARATFVCAAKK